jgi:hypothetical protein
VRGVGLREGGAFVIPFMVLVVSRLYTGSASPSGLGVPGGLLGARHLVWVAMSYFVAWPLWWSFLPAVQQCPAGALKLIVTAGGGCKATQIEIENAPTNGAHHQPTRSRFPDRHNAQRRLLLRGAAREFAARLCGCGSGSQPAPPVQEFLCPRRLRADAPGIHVLVRCGVVGRVWVVCVCVYIQNSLHALRRGALMMLPASILLCVVRGLPAYVCTQIPLPAWGVRARNLPASILLIALLLCCGRVWFACVCVAQNTAACVGLCAGAWCCSCGVCVCVRVYCGVLGLR